MVQNTEKSVIILWKTDGKDCLMTMVVETVEKSTFWTMTYQYGKCI